MPGLCDPETELPLSTWRVTLVVAPISLPQMPARACPPGGRAGHPRGFGCCVASAVQTGVERPDFGSVRPEVRL